MSKRPLAVVFMLVCIMLVFGSLQVGAQDATGELTATLFVSGLEGGSGSTVGPDGALYVAENSAGRIARVDPDTGEVTEFASGLPVKLIHTGGIMDIAFIDDTAYALVSVVGAAVGGNDVSGIYRIDDADSYTIIADIGQFALNNPPDLSRMEVIVDEGLQYAFEPYNGGFIVTDGHHNRIFEVTLDGDITEVLTLDNVVPTGIAVSPSSNIVYFTEAGPIPHEAENGKVMMFEPGMSTPTEVASGARLLIDVEYGCCGTLYGLSQGNFAEGNDQRGSPALPDTGSLVRMNADGTFTVLVDGLNQPTSLEFMGDTAFVITFNGEIWRIENVSR